MKRDYALASLALLMTATAPATAAGKLPGLNLPGAVSSSSAAQRDIGTARKLLKTIFRSAADNDGMTPLVSADANTPELYDVPGTSVSVTCPKDTKCLIEATVSFSWFLTTAQALAGGSVKIDTVPFNVDGTVFNPVAGIGAFTSWTYVKQVNAGTHVVQPFVAYAGSTELYGHSLVIRLYQR